MDNFTPTTPTNPANPVPAATPAPVPRTPVTPAPTSTPRGVLPPEHGREGGRGIFFWGAIILAFVVVVALAIWLWRWSMGPEEAAMVATPTPAATSTPSTPTPTPTPTAVLSRADWKFEVLNGSGVGGAAAQGKQALEDLGYEVGPAGNADNQDYTQTVLLVVDPENEQIDLLLDDLQQVFPGITLSSETPEVEGDINAQIIIGKDGQPVAVSPSPTSTP